jgi:cytochrome c biogenesis protein CcmG, thiol:disulfide interchange protein DsbE
MKKILILAVVMLTVLGCRRDESPAATGGNASARGVAGGQATGSEVGATIPEYTAISLDGTRFDLSARRKNVVLLNLWATWCAPCRYEIPELQAIHDKYRSKGFEVIGVSVDESGVEAVQEFVDEYRMTYPVVLDPEGRMADILQTSVLPTTVMLDREGTIVWKRIGVIEADDEELLAAIEKTL